MDRRARWRSERWVEVADRILVWRQPILDVNAVLVLGATGALVVDTLSTTAQARELGDAVRRVTSLPWRVVNTHHHFDHTFGNGVFAPDAGTEVWAHVACVRRFTGIGALTGGNPAPQDRAEPDRAARDRAARDRAARDRAWIAAVSAEYADLLPELSQLTALRAPDHPVLDHATLDLGDRTVGLRHLGRGHTDNDLVVVVPDASTVLAGDLVEDGAPPSFEDSWPLEWPTTVAALLELVPEVVVPGHGGAMTPGAVRAQHAELVALERICRQGRHDHATPADLAVGAPFGAKTAQVAIERAYAHLGSRL